MNARNPSARNGTGTATWIAVVLTILGLLIGLLIQQIWDVKAEASENRKAITETRLTIVRMEGDIKYIREKIDTAVARHGEKNE
jgi:hypothetical protein